MKKRILSILLTLVMVIGMLPTVAFAAGPEGAVWEGNTAKWNAVSGADTYSVILYKDGKALGGTKTTGTSYDFSGMMDIKGDGEYTFVVSSNADSYAEKSTSAAKNYTSSQVAADESTLLTSLRIGGKAYMNAPGYGNRIKAEMSGTGWTYSESGDSFSITLTSEYTGEPISVENANAYAVTGETDFVGKINGYVKINGDVSITATGGQEAIKFSHVGHMFIDGRVDAGDKLTINSNSASAILSTGNLKRNDWPNQYQLWTRVQNLELNITADSLSKNVIRAGVTNNQSNDVTLTNTTLTIKATNSTTDIEAFSTNLLELGGNTIVNIDLDRGAPLDAHNYNSALSSNSGTLTGLSSQEYSFEYSDNRTNLQIVPVGVYKVTFDANGGEVSPATCYTGVDGKLSSLPVPTHTDSNKEFDSWYTAKESGTNVTTNTVFTSDATVYARWSVTSPAPKYAVTVNGGSSPDNQYEYAAGETVTIEAGTPEGKQFKEWTGADDLTFIDGTSKTSATAKFTMPAKAVTVTATYEPIPAPATKYAITVNGGSTADMQNEYAEGAAVTIEAGSAPEGQQFKEWTGADDLTFIEGTSKTSAIATFTMPAKAVTVTATYEPIPAPATKYAITVYGGSTADMQYEYAEGAAVTIKAGSAPEGQQFKEWTGTDGLTFIEGTSKTSAIATFTMPAKAVTVTATYEPIPAPAPEKTAVPTITYDEETFTVTATGDGTVILYVDGVAVENPYTFEQDEEEVTYTVTATAQEEDKLISETATKSVTVPAVQPTEYDITVTGGTASANKAVEGTSVTITANAAPAGKVFDKWVIDGITVEDPTATTITFTMPANSVSAEATYKDQIFIVNYLVTFDFNDGTGNTAKVLVAQGDTVAKPADPTRSGYTFKGWYLNGTKYDFTAPVTETITLTAKWDKNSTGGGIVIPTVFPVTVKESDNGEVDASAKYAVPGSTVKLTVTPDEGYELDTLIVKSGSKFINVTEKNGKYQFVMPFGSVTVTATFKAVNPYNDVDTDDWFYDDVLYVTLKDLMNGTGNGKFSPEITTDRAMLVTVLWRLEGCPVVDSPVAFDDVADGLWYSDAIDWASANGIVNGYGNGKFGPTDQITREQIMAILNRYAAYKNWTDGTALPMIPQYNCSIWAENNVIWADMNGLLNGLGVDITDMTAKASRAELAAYLARFYKAFAEN